MMGPEFIIFYLFLLPPLYFLYLMAVKPWSRRKTLRKRHNFCGREWVNTEAGGVALDRDRSKVFIYKFKEES